MGFDQSYGQLADQAGNKLGDVAQDPTRGQDGAVPGGQTEIPVDGIAPFRASNLLTALSTGLNVLSFDLWSQQWNGQPTFIAVEEDTDTNDSGVYVYLIRYGNDPVYGGRWEMVKNLNLLHITRADIHTGIQPAEINSIKEKLLIDDKGWNDALRIQISLPPYANGHPQPHSTYIPRDWQISGDGRILSMQFIQKPHRVSAGSSTHL